MTMATKPRTTNTNRNNLRCLLVQLFLLASSPKSSTAGDDAADSTSSVTVEHPNCRLFIAESTIPHAGLGIFTGIDLHSGDAVAEPDIVVPLQDWDWHASEDTDFWFLWQDYSWHPSDLDMASDMMNGSALVLGTGCMPNCNFALLNAHEGKPDYDHAGLHRSKDPGSSAFTGFHNQKMIASRHIPSGGEIFVNYGEHWFDDREEMRDVPFEESFNKADKFLKKFKKMSLKYQQSDNPDFTLDLWDVVKTEGKYESKGSNALPLTFEDMQSAQTIGSAESRLPYSVRTLEWLNEHGRCMDNIRPGNSTIEQAGRGAFATRFIPAGGLVAPGPLLQIPNKNTLNLYDVAEDGTRDTTYLLGKQLILNYCFGHERSTVILCPYTSPSAYINHNSKAPNAKIVWSEDSTPNHNAYWLDEGVDFLKRMSKIGLSIDFVATREIQPGEEVFIDYGPEWETAWDEYVKEWSPIPDSDDYISATILQKDLSAPLRVASEQISEPYQPHIVFYCHYDYEPGVLEGPWEWTDDYMMLPMSPCNIIYREATGTDGDGTTVYHYAVVMLNESEIEIGTMNLMQHFIPAGENHILTGVPRYAIQVRDKLYTKDEFIPNSFRHEMMMPDEIFPDTWKNL